jgi:site-specific recombinase XerD
MLEYVIKEFINLHKAVSSKATVYYYESNLTRFNEFFKDRDIKDISRNDYIEYISYLRDSKIKNVSIRTYCRAVKVFSRYALKQGYISKLFTEDIPMPKDDSSIIIPLTAEEVEVIDYYLNLRNYCIFHLMLDCGLRFSEVINLNDSDIKFKERFIIINQGKNYKSRFVPLPEFLGNKIKEYKRERFTRSNSVKWLFDNKDNTRITKDTVKNMFSKLKDKSGVTRVHAHLLRHTFATSFILGGGNLEMLRILMGHSDYAVTQKYLHVAAQMGIIGSEVYKLDRIFFKNYNNKGE